MNTVVQDAIEKFGVDNIFMISSSYHGLYQDDYCYFTYYNNITGEIFKDEWSTAFAAPAFGNFECMTFKEAFEKGLVNKELLYSILKERNIEYIKSFDKSNTFFSYHYDKIATYGLRVEVYKGRKWKGVGFLIDTFTTSYQWGVKLWKSDNDYGTSKTTHAKIYDPLTNRIETVGAGNIRFLDADNLKNAYINDMLTLIEKTTVEDLTSGMTLNYEYVSFEKWLESHKNVINLDYAFDVIEEAKKVKEAEFKEKKMPELIEWVKNNTDKEGDEINELAERIFNKKYGNNN